MVEKALVLMGSKLHSIQKRKKNPAHNQAYRTYVHGYVAASWMMMLYVFLGKWRQKRIREALKEWRASPNMPQALNGQKLPASCHPDKPRVARGLCNTCYREKRRLEKRAL